MSIKYIAKELNCMNFIISGKNMEVGPRLRNQIESKLGKLEKYFTPETDIIVTVSAELERPYPSPKGKEKAYKLGEIAFLMRGSRRGT